MPKRDFVAVCSSSGTSGPGGDCSRGNRRDNRNFSHRFNLTSGLFSISTDGGGVGIPAIIAIAMGVTLDGVCGTEELSGRRVEEFGLYGSYGRCYT